MATRRSCCLGQPCPPACSRQGRPRRTHPATCDLHAIYLCRAVPGGQCGRRPAQFQSDGCARERHARRVRPGRYEDLKMSSVLVSNLELTTLPIEDPVFAADPNPYLDEARKQHPWLARFSHGYV